MISASTSLGNPGGLRTRLCWRFLSALGFVLATVGSRAADFSSVEPLLQEHCVECHGRQDPEGGLVLESAAELIRGGESGPAVVAGRSAESLLVKALEGNWGKTGKNQFMPPGKRERLKPEQIALFKAWIDAGAPLPTAAATPKELTVPRIEPTAPVRRPVNALAFDPASRLLAVARSDAVELMSVDSRKVARTLRGFHGPANAVVFSPDGTSLWAGAGDATGGEIHQWNTADGTPRRLLGGHRDAVFALALAPDGQTLASGSYDYGIRLWNTTDGSERSSLKASQGAIMGLAFRPDGRVLAGVGYDRTAKLFDASTGARLETLGQALKELNAVAISPDGQTLLTGGNDNRIRVYRLGPEAKEGSNPLVDTVFAHEGGILRIAYSPDGRRVASSANDRTVRLFDGVTLKPQRTLEIQPDWPSALTFVGNDILAVGRADGSLAFYRTADGNPAPPPKPELARTQPRGIQCGTSTRVVLEGRNLEAATVVSVYRNGRLVSAEAPGREGDSFSITLEPEATERPGAWELTVGDGSQESARVKVWIENLPQLEVSSTAAAKPAKATAVNAPLSVWSTLQEPGRAAEVEFTGRAGRRMVLDLAAQRLGSKGEYVLVLLDSTGRTLARSETRGGPGDPFVIAELPADGPYRVRVVESNYGGSADHFFRLGLGDLPFITGIFPLSVTAGSDADIEVMGVNLGTTGSVRLPAREPGDAALPPEAADWRSRRDWRVTVTPFAAPVEIEPNDSPERAMEVPVPVSVNGRLESTAPGSAPDVDLFRFKARRGVRYVIETAASQRGSPVDTRLEVLHTDGRPVERLRLQALRNSAITFRPETSDDTGIRFENWEEMELNDLLWCGGEVMKLFRAPQGPDSDSVLYSAGGRRRGYFDTTPTAHYLDEPVYSVVALAPGEMPVPNGLPVFTLNYANEDAALRDVGTDSRLHFTTPADGEYLVRVSDARAFGGHGHTYALVIREAQPDFSVQLNGASPSVAAGSGQPFTVAVRRVDGFEGPVRVEFLHLPAGWSVTGPLVIEAGHDEADGVLNAAPDAVAASDADWDAVTGVASAEVEGRPVVMAVNNLGRPKLVREPPKLLVRLEPLPDARSGGESLPGLVIAPGGVSRARLSIVRKDFTGEVTYSVENLPHGVIVENLGLNGITFLPEESEREISLAAANGSPTAIVPSLR